MSPALNNPNQKKVALFVGSDIVALLILNKVVPMMIESGYEPVLFFPDHRTPGRITDKRIKDFGFFERKILGEVVYPFIDEGNVFHSARVLTPAQLSERYDLQLIPSVQNVNSQEFIDSLDGIKGLKGGLSIRCFQIFQQPIIDKISGLNGSGFFYNLHPGQLPAYRGVYSTAWQMARAAKKENGNTFGCTLHEIVRGIDEGHIINKRSRLIQPEKTVYATNIELADLGHSSISDVFTQLASGNVIETYPQASFEGEKKYYTYPTPEQLDEWDGLGVRLFDPAEVKERIIHFFSKAGTPHGERLSTRLDNAFAERGYLPSPSNDSNAPALSPTHLAGGPASGPRPTGRASRTPPLIGGLGTQRVVPG